MKALILGGSNSRNSGGIFNTARALGLNLSKCCQVNVHYMMYDDEYSIEDRQSYEPLPLHSYSVRGPKNLGFSPDMYAQISRINPDIIHTQGLWMYLSSVNKRYHAKTNTAYVVSPHGMLDAWQLKQSAWKDLTKKMVLGLYEAKHLRQANCIHALCRSEEEAIRNFGLVNPVAVIPNGIDLPPVVSRNDSALPAGRWNKTNERKTLLFLSRIHPKKGLENLLKAWALTQPRQHEWQLVIAGEAKDVSYQQSLLNLMRQLHIADTVQFIGGQFNANKQACYVDADAFILPSFSEGLPIAVLEAWSYSLPVVMTPFCNLPEGLQAGAAIETDTVPESIAAGMQALFAMNETQRSAMGHNGRRLVEEKFTWGRVARSTMQLYQWVLGKVEKPNFVS